MNPRIIKLHIKGHNRKVQEIDYLLWLMGKYVLDAESVALAHFGAGLAGKTSQAEYLEKPYMQDRDFNDQEPTEEEKQRGVDKFFAQESARRAYWRRTHKNNSDS